MRQFRRFKTKLSSLRPMGFTCYGYADILFSFLCSAYETAEGKVHTESVSSPENTLRFLEFSWSNSSNSVLVAQNLYLMAILKEVEES